MERLGDLVVERTYIETCGPLKKGEFDKVRIISFVCSKKEVWIEYDTEHNLGTHDEDDLVSWKEYKKDKK
jgi:hypothetical protein